MANRSRRQILAGTGAALAAACATQGETGHLAPAPNQASPNFLWLVSEDNNPLIGAYGDRLAHTPAIDKLAREGVLFRNVYSNAPVCAPSRFGIITGVLAQSCSPANHMRAEAKLPAFIKAFPVWLRERGYYCSNNAKTDYNCDLRPEAVWDASSRTAHWRERKPDQPFFAVFNHETTHESQLFRRTDGRVRPEDVRIPAFLPDTPDMRADFASYYNLIERMDGQIGARLDELDAAGLSEDTIVFYYSDNGGVLPRSKRYCYDEGLRCALVVRTPAKFAHLAPPPGTVIDTPVSFIDLAPTLLALAGASLPAHLNGRPLLGKDAMRGRRFVFGMRNRMDERYDFVRTATDGRFRYIRNYMPHRPWGAPVSYAWQAKGYQDWERRHLAGALTPVQDRFFGPKPFEELYDLKADRDQVENLAASPAHAARLTAMRDALDAHMLEIRDNGFIPEGAPMEGYLSSRDERDYPLKTLMALGALAAQRNTANLAALAAQLDHANPLQRHWAAQGLLMLGVEAAPARARLAQLMATDSLPQTRIVAAEAVAGLGDPTEAVDLLSSLLDPAGAMPVRLQAINALGFLGEKAQPALPAIARAAEGERGYVRTAARHLLAVLKGAYDPAMPIFDTL